jgi:carbonic anhydrase
MKSCPNNSRHAIVTAAFVLSVGWLSHASVSRAADSPPAAAPAADTTDTNERALSPDDALERLMAGNRRFVAAKQEHPHDTARRRDELKDSQHPFAIVLGCADSRVAPELVFDQGLGDIFVVRVAGNVADPALTGSVSYAVHHLHAQVLVVLGHQSCGAVKAALMTPAELAKEPQDIQALVHYVQPSLKDVSPTLSGDQKLRAAIQANVRRTVSELEVAPSVKEAVAGHHLKIVGGVYDLESGKVEILP